MKSLVIMLATVLATTSAFADELRTPCEREDYVQLALLLKGKNASIVQGAEKVSALWDVLTQEMGPTCNKVVDLSPRMGIPGDKYGKYEVISGSTTYNIGIVFHGVEGGYSTSVYVTSSEN